MRTRSLATAALAAVLLLPAAGRAAPPPAVTLQARTAGDLAELCAANPADALGAVRASFCHGFAQGAIDDAFRRTGDKKPFCFPTPTPSRNATLGEFVSWVRAMPDRRNQPALEGLFQFMAERFPCKP
jgi:hypothetical protein